MSKFRVYFSVEHIFDSIVIEADSMQEAQEEFEGMSADEVMDASGVFPEFEVEEIEEA